MGRIELQAPIDTIEDLQSLINRAKACDAVCVPPFFVETAAAMLGRNKITIVTTAGRDEDMLDTKLIGIESAAKAGANEVIVCIPPPNIRDDKWGVIEKELFRLGQLCDIHRMVLWVGCKFHSIPRSKQVKICELLPRGLVGLRVREASIEDIQLAKICGAKGFCACFDYKPSPETIVEMMEVGATQFTLTDKPEQLKTTQLQRTEVSL